METNSNTFSCQYQWGIQATPAHQHLIVFVELGDIGATLFVYDKKSASPVALRHYALPMGDHDYKSFFLFIISELKAIDPSLSIHRLCIDRSDYTIVPNAFLAETKANEHLSFLFGSNDGFMVNQVSLFNDNQCSLIYRYPNTLSETTALYSLAPIGHSDQWILERSLQQNGLHCFIDPVRVKVHYIQNNQLIYAGSSGYINQHDILYFLLTVCNQYHIDRNTVHVLLNGSVSPSSALYKTVFDYFINLNLAETETPQSDTDELPAYFYSTLKYLVTCES
ncbi:MAG: DUF3822 family protein [Ferruginibacter sp.]